ncbi:unnamed protein product [Blepharisma stoltei]|uniref:RING-type domain-containing protein n=1 Tax=Blepharisma stoltei TaxID=1481888 RepID=A0AAU9JL76_9CILI|nr:unnamed protein product [Blepharisma stoltei]
MVDKEQKRFNIKKWNAVVLWAWHDEVEKCAICRESNSNPCINCQLDERPGISNECDVVCGACNHIFHFHCIFRFYTSRHVCPIDGKEFEIKRTNSNSINSINY